MNGSQIMGAAIGTSAGLSLVILALVADAAGPPAEVGEKRPVIGAGQVTVPQATGAIAEPGRLRVGDRYSIRLSERLEIGGQTQRESLELSVRAVCAEVPLSELGERNRSAGRCDEVSVTTAGDQALGPGARAALQQALAQPFVVERSKSGALLGVGLSSGVDPLAAGMIRYLVGAMQWIDGPGDGWSAEEIDSTGLHHSRYRRVEPRRWEKLRSNYRARSPELPGVQSPRLRGEARATWIVDEEGTFSTIREHLEVEASTLGDLRVRTRVELESQRVAGGTSLVDRLDLARATAALHALPPDTLSADPGAQQAADRRRVAGATAHDLIAALHDPQLQDPERMELVARLEALLRLDPGSAATLADAAQRSTDRTAAAMIISALGEVGTNASEEALAALAEAPDSIPGTRIEAITSLGLTDAPNRQTVALLDRLARQDLGSEVGRSAAFALGAAAGTLRFQANERAPEAAALLLDNYHGTADLEARRVLLLALGNTGDPRLVELVRSLASEADSTLASTAIEALRLIPGPDAEQLLVAALLGADPELKRAAARAALDRPLRALIGAMAQALESQDPVVRAELIRVLGQRLADTPEAAALLLSAATRDPDVALRALAEAYLRGAGAG